MIEALERNSSGMPVRELGKTGLKVSVIGFGGGHFVRPTVDEQLSVRLVHEAIDAGMTFMDTAWEYHNGESERRMGLALHDRRDKVVLMTKVCARDSATATAQLHESLRRLQTDVIDVWQFHEVNYDNDPELIFQAGGAIEAAVAARDAGKIRFIGFTGHKSPHILQKMLDQDFAWDTCQMPVNVVDPSYHSFIKQVLPELQERRIALLAMKTLADGRFFGEKRMGTRTVWQTKAPIVPNRLSVAEALYFAWSLPISVLITGAENAGLIREKIALAKSFSALDGAAREHLIAKVADLADGKVEYFKRPVPA